MAVHPAVAIEQDRFGYLLLRSEMTAYIVLIFASYLLTEAAGVI